MNGHLSSEQVPSEQTVEQRTNRRMANDLLEGERTYSENAQVISESPGEIALQDAYILTETVASLISTVLECRH